MAQYDDFSNPPSRPGSPGEAGLSAHGNGGSNGSGRGPDAANDEDWRSRSSANARRRNQWRQYKHMTPDFGQATPEPTIPAPSPTTPMAPAPHASAKEAALPSFRAKGNAPQGSNPTYPAPTPALRSVGAQGSRTPMTNASMAHGPEARLPAPRPYGSGGQSPSLHPHSAPLGTGMSSAAISQPIPQRPPQRPPQTSDRGTGSPNNITPLRSRDGRRRSAGMVTGIAAAAAATTAGLAALAAPPRPEAKATRTRQFSPQRRLAKLPRPALYMIRLAILGVGVAAIAGTLLSVLSPSNVASNGSVGPSPSAPAQRGNSANALPGQGATTIAAIQPSSELTRLKAQLDQLATLTPGLTPSVYAFDIDSGRYVDLSGSQSVAAASTIKVPILVAFLQQVDAGNLALNQAVVLQEQHLAGGSGTLANDAIGSEYTALDVATRMIIHSDNTATNMMIEALGGQEALNQQFLTWGLESTVLRNPLPDLEGTNTTSTHDLALLMALVDQGDLLSRRSRERLFSVMQRTVNRSLIAFSLTDGSLVANKTGDIALALGDVALVDTPNGNRYALAVMVQRPNNDGRASELIRRITETVHRELNQPIAPVGGRPTTPDGAADGEANPTPDDGEANPSPDAEMSPSPDGEANPSPDAEAIPPDADSSGDLEPAPIPDESERPNSAPSGDQIPPG